MNRIILSLWIVILMSNMLMADGLDSLRIQSKSENDTLRFKAILRMAVAYRKMNLDSSLYFLNLAERELKVIKQKSNDTVFRFLRAEYKSQKATYFQQADLYDSSQLYYEFALKVFKELGENAAMARVVNNLGALQEQRGNYPEALSYYFELMRLCDSLELKDLKARALINIGVVYNNQSNYDEALKYYEEAVPLKRELGDQKGEALLYNNIGIVYYFQGNYEKVLEFFKRSLNIYREIGDLRSQAMPYFNIAEIYYLQKAYKEALYYYKKSYEIDKQLGERASQAETLSSIGRVYADLGQTKDALRVHKESLRLLKKLGAKSKYANSLQETSLTYESIGDYKNALKYYKEYKLMHDSVHTIKKESQIAHIKEQYESEKKDQQIDLLQQRNKVVELENIRQRDEMKNRKRISILSLLVAALVLLALIMIYRMYRHKKLSNQMLEIKNESITEKNQEISAIVEKLEKALKSREVLYANTTHELRTPLNIINGFTNLLQHETNPKQRESYVDQVKSSTNHLLRLIEDMLVISRLETGQFELVFEGVKLTDLTQYLDNIFRVLANTKQIKYICSIDKSCPEIITIDPIRYFQIISNLIDNAIKYTEAEGEVSITFFYINNRFLKVEVKDSGYGINKEKQNEIFERYSRIKNSEQIKAEGSGLGLNIVQQLVDLFEGQIEVDSKPGEGSVFKVTIPTEEAFHVTYRYAVVYDETISEKLEKGRILIAEDNVASAELLKQTLILYNPKLTMEFVQNGHDALTQLRKNTYDLFICDIKMPLMDGIEVVNKLKTLKDNPNVDIPVIGISAQTDDETRKSALDAGINEFLPKPYETGVLILKIEELALFAKKRMLSKQKADEKNNQSEKNHIGQILNSIDSTLRNREFEDAIKQINTLQSSGSTLITEAMHSILNELERELVTTQRKDKIGKLMSKLFEFWQ